MLCTERKTIGRFSETTLVPALKYVNFACTLENQKKFRAFCTSMGFLQFPRAHEECGTV